jgi:hypothetical protein
VVYGVPPLIPTYLPITSCTGLPSFNLYPPMTRLRGNILPRIPVSVTVAVEEYTYVRNNRMEFSALLSAAIRAHMTSQGAASDPVTLPTFEDGPVGDFRRWLADRNAAGLTTAPEEIQLKRIELKLDPVPLPPPPPTQMPEAERKALIRKALEEERAKMAAKKSELGRA